jgi:type VI secretion system protein ImpL
MECPVTFLITKCDALPYFSDFFRRLPESEIGQVLGCGFSLIGNKDGTNAPSAEAEFKRLTRSFNSLFRSLADKRITHLAHEPDAARRPGIYEFPRELKRIRPALVQFLTSVFRPHALRPSPQLNGYYLTAIGEREIAPSLADTTSHSHWSEVSVSLEATSLFRGDAIRVQRGGGSGGDLSSIPKQTGGTTRRWLFVSELFQSFLAVPPLQRRLAKPLNSGRERQLRAVCFAVCSACFVLCCMFATSWTRNLRLLDSVHNSTAIRRTAGPPTISELEALEDLRQQVRRLTTYYHDGPPLSLRWGLYSGSGILEPMRAEYFQRFQQLLLQPLNTSMTAKLAALPTTPGPDAPYSPAFRVLKAHLMISSGDCKPEPAFVWGVLKETRNEVMPSRDPAWQALADRQIQFYTDELGVRNPCRLVPDVAAREHARQYLASIQGVDRLYSGILSAAEKFFSRPQKLAELAPNYAQVLSGPNEISGVFSRDGWTYIEKASQSGSTSSAESCVLGNNSIAGRERKPDADNARAIQRLFIRDYVDKWRKYVSAFSVLRYYGSSDAAHKLDILSDHKSPLLALLAMTSNQTNFPVVAPEPEGLEKVKPMVTKFFPALGVKSQPAGVGARRPSAPQELFASPADITKAFQPVHSVVPPGSDTWVVDKNAGYVDALAALGHSMRDLGKAFDTPDPAVLQTASQNYDKALDAARQIARVFQPMGVGMDVAVARLLEAPIRQTQALIPSNLDNLTAGKVNGQLHLACEHIRPTLRKYPFQSSEADATLEEVAAAFAPSVGAIWKFQAQYLGDWTVKDGNRWKEKDPGKKPQVTPEMLNFLNRAQTLSDVFYPSGSSQPQLTYTLRPKLDPSFKDATLELDVDGQPHLWTSSLQKQFVWPAPPGSRNIEVKGIIRTGSLSFPFTSRGGIWAIFRVMSDGEPRALSSRVVEWKHIRGGGGRMEEIQPAPVRLEFVEFPGGVDLFNPKFFNDLQCPIKALQ